jgi:DNA-binding NtrC family response regulator
MALLTSTPPRHATTRQEQPTTKPAAIWHNPYPTILLVDDDAAVRESLCRVLAGQQFHVICAGNGTDALRLIEQHEPDLMITDLCMASVDGWDLLVRENRLRPALPVFVITALPARETCGADQFATEFFQKPLDLDALIAAIRRHLHTQSSHHQPSVSP